VSGELIEVGFRQVHEDVDFILTSLEILNRESIDGNHFNPRPQTRLQNLSVQRNSATANRTTGPSTPVGGGDGGGRGCTFFRVSAPE
jgi:hypothetical protein